jgi:hypothetical protein
MIALVQVVENNRDNKNSQIFDTPRHYFNEALTCFDSWNELHPEIKKYAICVTKATLNDNEVQKLEDLGVTYIEAYHDVTEDFEYGFYNVPIALKWAEENLDEEIFIHTDLDMKILKRIDKHWISLVKDNHVIIGMYSDYDLKYQRDVPAGWANPFDTGFQIYKRTLNFNEFVSFRLQELRKTYKGNLYDLEEHIIDEVYNVTKEFNIYPVLNYQFGEGYSSVKNMDCEEFKNVTFLHEHYIQVEKFYDSISEQLAFHKKRRECK